MPHVVTRRRTRPAAPSQSHRAQSTPTTAVAGNGHDDSRVGKQKHNQRRDSVQQQRHALAHTRLRSGPLAPPPPQSLERKRHGHGPFPQWERHSAPLRPLDASSISPSTGWFDTSPTPAYSALGPYHSVQNGSVGYEANNAFADLTFQPDFGSCISSNESPGILFSGLPYEYECAHHVFHALDGAVVGKNDQIQGRHHPLHGVLISPLEGDANVVPVLDNNDNGGGGADDPKHWHCRPLSTISLGSSASSAASSFSPVQTELTDFGSRDQTPTLAAACASTVPAATTTTATSDTVTNTDHQPLVCLGPHCQASFPSEAELDAHCREMHAYTCNWVGCARPSFSGHQDLVWHVQVEHLLVCPANEPCMESSFSSTQALKSHIAVAHPGCKSEEDGDAETGPKEWQLKPDGATAPRHHSVPETQAAGSGMQRTPSTQTIPKDPKGDQLVEELRVVSAAKRRYQQHLRTVLEKRAKKNAAVSPRAAASPTDLVRSRASRLIESASFPLVFEHAVLPFLVEFLPRWCGSRHVVSVTRGRRPVDRRICVMTPDDVTRTRKMIIAGHVCDLLPDKFRQYTTFVFSRGCVDRNAAATWARGLSREHMDDVCAARNPYFYRNVCMGDSIGIRANGNVEESAATLGPSLRVGGGTYWLGNFHPFVDAYQQLPTVEIEHPAPQDRTRCIEEGHDAMSCDDDFRVGRVAVTSGLNLKTTRVTHDAYWEENDKEQPLIVTDWALISARTSSSSASPSSVSSPASISRANMLRRFPSETQPLLKENLVCSTSTVAPGGPVVSSGRTSGYQRGQVCEIPAYVSGDENGTMKATREWFIEEPYDYHNHHHEGEEAWIRGGIGVEGDSGAAVVDAESNCLVGQLWGRNRYWGPGPRHAFFTPIADILDDIQEKCGQQSRPRLPQTPRDEGDQYPVYPSCRQCYDLRTYLESRRSSRTSLQSMIMGVGGSGGGRGSDLDQDLTSIEAVSELATPRDYSALAGVEEAGSSFNSVLSPIPGYPGTPMIAELRSPYAQTLEIEDIIHDQPALASSTPPRKRMAPPPPLHSAVDIGSTRIKRSKVGD